MKKFFVFFCLGILLFHLFQIIYSQRALFTQNYDVAYWKDRYEHSQYQLPLSKRIIGDDGLFAYAGYRLINGDNPFSINNDKPPVAKYLFGLSIILFHSPLYIVLLFGLFTLITFYYVAKHFLKDTGSALIVTVILFLDPLFFSQFWITGLDLIQLFFLLFSLLLLINIKKLRKWNILALLVSGLSLGFFVEVKPPILFPFVFILETVYIFYKGLKKGYLIFIIGFLFGIILPYFRLIFLGNSVIDILKVHKFMASIYLQSQLKTHVGAIWQTLLIGKFPNIATGSLAGVAEWWVLWPIITFSGILMAISSFFTKKIPIVNRGFAIFLLAALIVFTLIPSYPRYLVLVLPFLYLFGISFLQRFFKKTRSALYIILLVFGIINSFLFLFPKPDVSLNGFYYNLSHLFFQDIYQENISNINDLGLTRSQFRYIANKALNDATIKEIEIKELDRNISMFATAGNIKLRVTYKTQDLGAFSEEKIIKLVQRDGQWKIQWDWNLVFNGFSPSFIVQTETTLGKRGSIISPDGKILAQDHEGYLVSVNPEKIDLKKEQEMLKFIGFIGNVKPPHLQNAYLENSLPGTYTPLFSIFFPLDQKTKLGLLSFPGVKLTSYPSRIYGGIDGLAVVNTFYKECCTRIYSSYNYHGVRDVEREYDSVLWGYSGGKILIRDSKRNVIKTVFEKDKKDGQDVILQ